MSDNSISAVTPAPLPPVKAPDEIALKILLLPPNLPPNIDLSGTVIAVKNGQVTLQTPQGMVMLETDASVNIGQKIDIAIKNNAPQPAIVKPAPTDKIILPQSEIITAYTPLQAQLASLPDNVPDVMLPVIINALSGQPVHQALPQLMAEGLEKFQLLTSLVTQANFVVSPDAQKKESNAFNAQTLLPTLQQLLNIPEKNTLMNSAPQSLIQLQTILPGQKISPEILLNVRQQLLTLLQPPSLPPDKPATLPVLQNLISQIIQPQAQTAQQTEPARPLFTLPAIGLVLTVPPQNAAQVKEQSLVLFATPQAQPLIGMLSPPTDHAETRLLPGTVLVLAFQPQERAILSLPLLPMTDVTPVKESFLPLHPALGDSWPVLDDLWDQVIAQQITAPEAALAIRQIVPNAAPQQMPPVFLFLLSIIKNDLASSWLPDKSLAKVKGIDKDAAIQQLTEDLRGIQSRNDDTIPADAWKPLPMPLQVGDQLLRLQWFYRYPQDDAPSDKNEEQQQHKKRKTRFLLDVPKTGFGDIQIDGLVVEKDLQIILRTETPLQSYSEAIIRTRYQNALETTGMQGAINFQAGCTHYVRV